MVIHVYCGVMATCALVCAACAVGPGWDPRDRLVPLGPHSATLAMDTGPTLCCLRCPLLLQAVYTSLKETETRATDLLPYWKASPPLHLVSSPSSPAQQPSAL